MCNECGDLFLGDLRESECESCQKEYHLERDRRLI